MSNVLNLQLTISLLVIAGYIIKKIGLVTEHGKREITNLVLYIILPCNILKAFMIDFNSNVQADIIAIFILSIVVQVFSYVYGRVFFRKEIESRRKCLCYGTICSNAGFLGNPIAEGLYDSYGLLLASIFLIPQRIMMWTEGIATFSNKKDLKGTFKNVIKHPCILACIFGSIIMIFNINLPAPITNTIDTVGACNTAFSMIVIGMIFSDINIKEMIDKTVLLYCLHRLIIIPLVFFIALSLFNVSSIVTGLVVILIAMPAGATTSILAAKYDMEPKFATKMVIISTLFSMITIAIWSIILV